jgi:hypothetical protein
LRLATLVVLAASTVLPALTASADASPPFIGPDPQWLVAVNYYRSMAGLPPVVEEPSWSSGAYLHSCYMLLNGISHDEIEGKPGYTPEGDLAGNNGNVAVTSVLNETARRHIELWMTGPFHAVGVLRPNLQRVGFGKCDNSSTSPWKSGGTLDVLRGLGPRTTQTSPILFPGNGMTTNLNKFVAESPNPLDFCGWSNGGGLPILALMPETPTDASATITGPSGPLETCVLTSANTSSNATATAILGGNNVVVAMPRNPLDPGSYTVTVRTSARSVTWSFTVDPNAATAAASAPAPTTTTTTPTSDTTPGTTPDPLPPTEGTASGTATGFEPLVPVRLVDTRENFGATELTAGVAKRIQIGGRGGIPADAKAASANFTITQPQGSGYLTVWSCSGDHPMVATLNYAAGDTVANAASVPFDSTGGICVYSTATTHLVVDLNGYYRTQGSGRFTSLTPLRLMDTRVPLGPSARIAAGRTVELQVAGVNGLPDFIEAAALNVASVDPSAPGFVTVWPCDAPRPWAASLNPVPGHVKPNLVIAPVSADGTVCFYTSSDVDLVVDLTGYLSASSPAKFTPSSPFRFTDTREVTRTDVNAGTGGAPLGAGQTLRIQMAGLRGIPEKARAVSVNIAVTGAEKPGFVTAFPCGSRPNTANVNYTTVTAISNGAQLPLSSDGALCIYVFSTAHVIIDVNGWWS